MPGAVGARKPDVAIERAWGGWIAMTPSWLPVAGEATRHVSYLIACNGHGLAQPQTRSHQPKAKTNPFFAAHAGLCPLQAKKTEESVARPAVNPMTATPIR
ncbi:hypothetical protein GCM10017688_15880 [Streptomyces ramulosus]